MGEGGGWLPSRRADSRPAESSYCREVGEEVLAGLRRWKKTKQNKNLSDPAVLSSCKNVMEEKKKIAVGSRKAKRFS